MVLTKYKGDNCELNIGISNDADSTSQNYGLFKSYYVVWKPMLS